MFESWLSKVECEQRLKIQYPELYSLIDMSWWHEQSPFRKWLTHCDKGYDIPLRVLERQLRIIRRLFPNEFDSWKGHLRNPHHVWSKIFEARCIELLDFAGIRITRLEPDHGTGKNPDLELEVNGKVATVECTSLHYDPELQQSFMDALEREEYFRMWFAAIRRPYYIILSWMPNLMDESATERFCEFFERWFATHKDGEQANVEVIPGFEGIRRTPGLSMARIVYQKDLPYVCVGGVAASRIVSGPQNTLKNRLNDKRKQVINQPSDLNIIAVDLSFRSDLLISKVVPNQFMFGIPADVDDLFARRNAEHIHAVHVSQMNIFSNAPMTPMSWLNKNAKTIEEDALHRVLQALSGYYF